MHSPSLKLHNTWDHWNPTLEIQLPQSEVRKNVPKKNKCCAESCTGRKGKCSNTRLGNLWICKSFKFNRDRWPTARCRKLHCFCWGRYRKNLLARKNHPIFSTKKISTNTTRGKNPSIATLELWKLRHLLEIHCGFTSALHPAKFTWNLQISQLKRKVIFQTSVFGFHDHFPGCTWKNHRSTRTSALVTQPRLPTRTSDRSSYCESVSPSKGTYHWEGVESEGEVLWFFFKVGSPNDFQGENEIFKNIFLTKQKVFYFYPFEMVHFLLFAKKSSKFIKQQEGEMCDKFINLTRLKKHDPDRFLGWKKNARI